MFAVVRQAGRIPAFGLCVMHVVFEQVRWISIEIAVPARLRPSETRVLWRQAPPLVNFLLLCRPISCFLHPARILLVYFRNRPHAGRYDSGHGKDRPCSIKNRYPCFWSYCWIYWVSAQCSASSLSFCLCRSPAAVNRCRILFPAILPHPPV